jgi:uncharacterized Zn finger protein (UPF0148 family)
MESQKDEVECPVCDRKIAADAQRCPNCGADFSMSGFEDLEQVARDLNDPVDRKAKPADQRVPEASKESDTPAEGRKKEGFLGRLFRKRR